LSLVEKDIVGYIIVPVLYESLLIIAFIALNG